MALTFLRRDRDEFVPITRGRDLRPLLPYLANTLAFDAGDFPGLSGSAGTGGCDCLGPLMRLLRPLIPGDYAAKSEADQVAHVSRNTFRLTVSSFIDAHDFELRSMRKECVHVITPDLRRIPFSAYNLHHRRP